MVEVFSRRINGIGERHKCDRVSEEGNGKDKFESCRLSAGPGTRLVLVIVAINSTPRCSEMLLVLQLYHKLTYCMLNRLNSSNAIFFKISDYYMM